MDPMCVPLQQRGAQKNTVYTLWVVMSVLAALHAHHQMIHSVTVYMHTDMCVYNVQCAI